MKRLGMLQRVSFVAASALAAMAFTACGDDDDGGNPDARVVDAPITSQVDARTFDAGGGATFDARPPDAATPDAGPTFSGTAAYHDIKIHGLEALGHGVQIDISFTQDDVPAEFSARVPGIIPCSAAVRDVTKAQQNIPGVNEGTVRITRTPTGGSAIAVPDCTFQNGDYVCTRGGGASGTITGDGTVGLFSNGSFTFNASDIGAYLVIPGATPAAFPIVGVSGMTAGLQNLGAGFPDTVGPFIVAHGIGPIALTADPNGSNAGPPPDLLADSDTITFQIVPGGGNHFAAYTTPALPAGDDFDLTQGTLDVFEDGLDLNSTTGVTLGCSAAECPAVTGTGVLAVTVINIQTTDTAGGGPTDLAPATKYSGSLTCANTTSEVTIPATLLAVLKQGNPRKMRIAVFRDVGDLSALTSRDLSLVAGHGHVVFQDVPAPTKK